MRYIYISHLKGVVPNLINLILLVTLTTGGTTSTNNSYIEVGTSTNLDIGSNIYTVCPCSDDICRIKFDFEVSKLDLKLPYTN